MDHCECGLTWKLVCQSALYSPFKVSKLDFSAINLSMFVKEVFQMILWTEICAAFYNLTDFSPHKMLSYFVHFDFVDFFYLILFILLISWQAELSMISCKPITEVQTLIKICQLKWRFANLRWPNESRIKCSFNSALVEIISIPGTVSFRLWKITPVSTVYSWLLLNQET